MSEDSPNQTPQVNQPTPGEATAHETRTQPVSPPPLLAKNGAPEPTPVAPPPSAAQSSPDAPSSSSDAPSSSPTDASPVSPVQSIQNQALEASIIEALRTVFDPEIPVNIYDMGLIYNIAIDADNKVDIRMTLTSPMCPVAGSLPPEVAEKAKSVEGVTDATVDLVWEPTWTPDNMSEAAKLQLNM